MRWWGKGGGRGVVGWMLSPRLAKKILAVCWIRRSRGVKPAMACVELSDVVL